MTAGQAAARWWADQISRHTWQDNGDSTQSIIMTAIMLRSPLPTAAQLATFETLLAASIDERLAGGSRWLPIGVDYHPDRELSAAAEAAGIERAAWPVKSMTWICPEYVEAARGYRAERQLIWGARTEATS